MILLIQIYLAIVLFIFIVNSICIDLDIIISYKDKEYKSGTLEYYLIMLWAAFMWPYALIESIKNYIKGREE